MEPAVYCLVCEQPDPALLDRVEEVLAGQGAPPVELTRQRGLLVFRCDTWDPILRARVSEAIATVYDHDGWQRLFRPVA